jgi:hypothetical protein
MSVSVPKSFPPGTQFGRFEGIPVSEDADRNVIAWDVPGGRRFLNGRSWNNPRPISEAEFRALVKLY